MYDSWKTAVCRRGRNRLSLHEISYRLMHLSSSIVRSSSRVLTTVGALVSLGGFATRADAQTDYYNTDRGRPVQIEDAYPTERYAFELKLAPVRLERARGGLYRWEARYLRGDGGNRAVHRGEHDISRKAIAQGRPECFR